MAGPERNRGGSILALRERGVADSASSSRSLEFPSETSVLKRSWQDEIPPSSLIQGTYKKQSRICRGDGTPDLLDFFPDAG